jgi:hypothetical protein
VSIGLGEDIERCKRRVHEQENAARLFDVVRQYIHEMDNPVPDTLLRKVFRDRMRELVKE